VLDVVKVLLVSSVSLIETFSLTVYMMVNNNTSSRFIVSAVSTVKIYVGITPESDVNKASLFTIRRMQPR
jgi:hypothetical protein